MTKISYIHGVPGNERKDRGGEVGKPMFIDYTVLTTGEMKAALLYEQLDIFKKYYPEAAKEYQAAQDKLVQAFQKGLGAIDTSTGYGQLMQTVNRVIAQAKNQNRPAAGKYYSLGQAADFVPLQGENCIPILDELRRVRKRLFSGNAQKEVETRLEACRQQERLVAILNQYLEKSGHHLLYAYAPANVTAKYGAVAAKRVFHNNAIGGFHNISRLNQANLRDWLRNGIIRYNAKGGLDPLQPEATVETFKNSVVDSTKDGVGLDPATATLIVTIIVAALKATVDLIAQLNRGEQNQMDAYARGIGTAPFGPEEIDFYSEGNSNNAGGVPLWALLAAGGVAAYALSK